MEEYDSIAEEYTRNEEERIQTIYLVGPSFMNLLGNLRGLNVLDLACGSGRFTRKIKLAGAKKVVGADISNEMIRLAKKEEEKNHLGIEYIMLDVTQPKKIGEFDIVSASFLFHYAKTKKELFNMCKTCYENLNEGGRLISIGPNPKYPLTNHKKYGFTLEGNEPVREGDELITKLFSENKEQCSFKFYHWKKETYEKAIRDIGFRMINWIPLKVSKEGIEKYGREFWKDFLNKPSIIMIEAIK